MSERLDTERVKQLNELMQTQAGHGDIINHTSTFKLARIAQAEVAGQVGPQSALLLGPGDGAEFAVILERARLSPDELKIVALELNERRAEAFINRFPAAELIVSDFSQGIFSLAPSMQFDLVQCGFVLNDQTEKGKRAIARSAWEALKPGGTLLIADIFLEKYPNIASFITSAEIEDAVNEELRDYYQPYLDQLLELEQFSEEHRDAFRQSIHKAWGDALEHKEGRESFDTRASFAEILSGAGFGTPRFEHVFNKCWVVATDRPL